MQRVGRITALYRYPVKSMGGESLTEVALGWHGLAGDRRLAFRRLAERGGYPWLTASKVAALVSYQPLPAADGSGALPTHVRTPDGRTLELAGAELRAELAASHGADVELMRLDQGIFDDAKVSVIGIDSVRAIERAAGRPVDVRRFRQNVVMETTGGQPFEEDAWVGRTLRFGDAADGAAVSVMMKDSRCVMINLDPDSGESDPAVMKAAVRLNDNDAGLYTTVVRPGPLAVGQPVFLI
jgi:MOSC domain-containing protein